MRKANRSYSALVLAGLLFAGSCSIIAEVDRTKIRDEGGPVAGEGGQGTGGSTGGTGARGGSAGSSPTGGTSGEGGSGAEGGAGADGGMGGMGEAGASTGGSSAGAGADAGAGAGGGSGDPECGNGVIEGDEECDDDGIADGDGCDSDCNEEAGWNCSGEPSECDEICGDGLVVGSEACDDGNSSACGTCAAGCTAAVVPASATGTITVATAAELDDGATFTLDDGYADPVTFVFDSDSSETPGPTVIPFTDTTADDDLRQVVINAINAATLFIQASEGSGALEVALVHTRATALGNVPITVGGTGNGEDIDVEGMAGGSAGDCGGTVGCRAAADCASLDCNIANQCTGT